MPEWLPFVEALAELPGFRCSSPRESTTCACDGCRAALEDLASLVNQSHGWVSKKAVKRFLVDNADVWERLVRRRLAAFPPGAPRPRSRTPRRDKGRRAIPKAVRQRVWTAAFGRSSAEGSCLVCRRAVTVWDFDVCHRISRSKGGSDDCDNLFVGCAGCNRRQGRRNLEDYLRLVGSAGALEKETCEATARSKT
jgi:5-methylcytosine-specific restriction endonuclease McrA